MTTPMDRRLDELRARRAARAAERAEFEERRTWGLRIRHAAKLAYLAARRDETRREEVMPGEADNSTRSEQDSTRDSTPEVA
jgi:hypothetical protein